MNKKLIFQLSLFGLAMALATITLIPATIEPAFWLVIFLTCAYIISQKAPGNYFLHGFLVSLVNCVWITVAHIFFSTIYLEHHPQEAAMLVHSPLVHHPRMMMLIGGSAIGIFSGLILGLFSWLASLIFKKKVAN
jgi:hypothetical protein